MPAKSTDAGAPADAARFAALGVWRAGDPRLATSGLPSRHPALAAHLPGGWPNGALTELLTPYPGIGELSLLLPDLSALTRADRRIAFVAPPHLPYPPALLAQRCRLDRIMIVAAGRPRDALWASEQVLRSGTCAAVVSWPPRADDRQLRRLQLAAERGRCWGIVFRELAARRHPSPAALRMVLEPTGDGRVRALVIKHRGGRTAPAFEWPRSVAAE